MIEIIKKGTRKVNKCDYCGCAFSFNEEDTKKIDHDRYFNGLFIEHCADYKKIIKCPQCNFTNILEEMEEVEPNGIN